MNLMSIITLLVKLNCHHFKGMKMVETCYCGWPPLHPLQMNISRQYAKLMQPKHSNVQVNFLNVTTTNVAFGRKFEKMQFYLLQQAPRGSRFFIPKRYCACWDKQSRFGQGPICVTVLMGSFPIILDWLPIPTFIIMHAWSWSFIGIISDQLSNYVVWDICHWVKICTTKTCFSIQLRKAWIEISSTAINLPVLE